MKYDCSKTLDFIHEFNRMCSKEHDCDCCQFQNVCDCTGLIKIVDITTDDIVKLQEWSDKHFEETRKDYYFQCFPYAEKDEYGNPIQCCKSMGLTEICPPSGECNICWNSGECNTCWNMPYKVKNK